LLPGETDLVVTVTAGIASTGLTPATGASGPHAFAVRTRFARHAKQVASIAFHPAFVAIAIRPSSGMERPHDCPDLGCESRIILKNRIFGFDEINDHVVSAREICFCAQGAR